MKWRLTVEDKCGTGSRYAAYISEITAADQKQITIHGGKLPGCLELSLSSIILLLITAKQCWASGTQIRIWGVGQTDTWILGRYLGSIWVSVCNSHRKQQTVAFILLGTKYIYLILFFY
jgi:hypothetical protein